ncbi:lysocardiolipin acyltransferase 1-like [Gigantopelta aegis]|uniref:lysocardiolipin acyltransferase 1-like n=1 Tax=Gigantopelta aegis TaxID=1735272 RepID=UPI001B88A243|nr:lysocardiolipin acyltransferase 1-like [Gigantopelta aegis]
MICSTMGSLVYGILFCTLLFLTSFLGTLCFLTPFMPFVLVNPWFARRVFDFFQSLWIVYAVALCEIMMGVKVIITGIPPDRLESNLIVMNHRTRLDWMFYWSYQIRCGSVHNMKISMKENLKYIPGPGWAMQCAAFIFLQRKWQTDKLRITAALKYYKLVDVKPQILLFPEGTDLTEETLATSNTFGEKFGYRKYKRVLHPRTTGFCFLVEEMKKNRILDSVVDITVAYPKNISQAEIDMLYGNFPKEIHFHVHLTPSSQLPETSDDLALWCRKQWEDKEDKLELFYEKKHFPVDDMPNDHGDCDENRNCDETTVKLYMYGALVFWKLFLIITLYGLLFLPYFRVYILISMICFYLVGKRHGGLDNVMFLLKE